MSPEPTVRGNDVAFAAHAVVLSSLTYSMFLKRLWGLEQRRGQKVSKGVLGIGMGCAVGVGLVIGMVILRGGKGGRDPREWAWIDVVGFVSLHFGDLCQWARGHYSQAR